MELEEFYKQVGGNFEDVKRRLLNEEFIRKFVLKFKDDETFDNLIDAFNKADYKEAFRFIHTLKGTSSSSSTEDIKTQIMNVNQEIKALNDQFYNLMSKEDIDQLITNLTIEHKISPTNLTMSEITQTDLSSKKSDDNSSDNANDNTDESKSSNALVYSCVITQTCKGTKANLLNLIEDVKNMSGLHINSVAYENSTGNLDLTITYTVYMVEK